ncbi:MAG: hypothetical protein K1Y02_09375 [Candidatus Hydrogenedentes bacterium]|nr:hypothetical protein [Candidatus Hydrogenedentota bacterium]
MIRILVMHPRDWTVKKPSYIERSIHEILKRIAAQGHYVAWLCGKRLTLRSGSVGVQELELVDGIHVARLGPMPLHRPLARLFLGRLAKSGSCPFDVVLNCVAGRTLDVASHLQVPVLPWVFSVTAKTPAISDRMGPIIATTQLGASQLRELGVPPGHIVFAPVGVNGVDYERKRADTERRVLVLGKFGESRLFRTGGARLIARLKTKGIQVDTQLDPAMAPWIAYCGEGHEWEALEFADRGIPVLSPNTIAARECVVPEETGLLHAAGNWKELEAQFERISKDEVLYKRLSEGAAKYASQRRWERSAGLVLAAIENMLASVS